MKFSVRCRNVGEEDEWSEPYEKDNVKTRAEAEQWAKECIEYFNDTCRSGEPHREVVGVVVDDSTADNVKEHDWQKSNLVTIRSPVGMYDAYRCRRCEVTAKRYGLGGDFMLDRKYRSAVYQRCDTSQAHFAKRRPRPKPKPVRRGRRVLTSEQRREFVKR